MFVWQKVARYSESIATKAICIGCLLLSITCQSYGAVAAPNETKPDGDDSDKPTSTSEDIVDLEDVQGLKIVAAACVRSKKYDRAIELAKHGIALDKDDIELHRIYADALDAKLRKQLDQDPVVFNTCIKEWLIVLHNEVGEEKGMSWHGLSLPLAERFYEDEDIVIRARKSLYSLAGSLPKPWETDNRYMKRVCKSTTAVHGKIVSRIRREDSHEKDPPTLWLK